MEHKAPINILCCICQETWADGHICKAENLLAIVGEQARDIEKLRTELATVKYGHFPKLDPVAFEESIKRIIVERDKLRAELKKTKTCIAILNSESMDHHTPHCVVITRQDWDRAFDVIDDKSDCQYCKNERVIEMDNNGPIEPCPVCRPQQESQQK